ncbi:lipoprotein-releasing ABC transporter permease subunit LolC [Escherichia albertii]|uniref:lipoprotein-releasing ABC transporter permease subunit LolC n=1 Tax=Escherichia albertii TaxID=208962 RepID=UPI0030C9EB7C
MYKPVTVFIGLRYKYGSAADRFSRFVSWLSTIGITLGVMALVTVLSVMNGFEREFQNNTLNLMPHAIISTKKGYVNDDILPAGRIKSEGVQRIAPLTTAEVVLQSAGNVAAGIMLGIGPTKKDPLAQYLVNVSQSVLQPGEYNVILGEQIAAHLGVSRGDKIRIMVPSASQFTPLGRLPAQRLFTVAGIFAAGSDIDNTELLVNIQDASRLMRYPSGSFSGWRLWLTNPLDVGELSQHARPDGITWTDWRERKGELYQAQRMEKNIMGLLLSLIVIVAAFNIVTSLGLMVMDKQAEVAVLQTQGLTSHQVMMVFIVQGASTGIIGALTGAITGILLAGQLNNLMPVTGLLTGNIELPVVPEPLQVIFVVMTTILISLLSTLYPAWKAAAIPPAEALRCS